jgi:hypothetical protein
MIIRKKFYTPKFRVLQGAGEGMAIECCTGGTQRVGAGHHNNSVPVGASRPEAGSAMAALALGRRENKKG